MTTEYIQKATNGNALFDYVIEHKLSRNDAQTGRLLGISAPAISNMRHGKIPIGASVILAFHETFDIKVKTIRAIANAPRKTK